MFGRYEKLVKTTRNKRSGGSILQVFIKWDVLCSKLEIQNKRGMSFSSDFCWYSIHFDIVR